MNRQQCEICAESFECADELAWHWFREHDRQALSDEELRAAIAEDRRRQETYTFTVTVPVIIPRERKRSATAREDVDPETADPEDVVDPLMDLMDLDFDFEVESSKDDATKYHA